MVKVSKKILTIDDLVQFCQEQQFSRFSSKDTGYQLAVKVPTTFEVENNDDNHRDMTKLKIKIFHTGINRNNSKVSKEAAEKAMKTIPDRPILAAIHQLDSGDYDFAGHEMEIVHNDKTGKDEINYIESQVGSFSSEPAFWEHDDELDKDFVCAYAYISNEYTRASEIINKKGYTKNSCELFIDEMSYDSKEHCLDLVNFYVSASTLLGSYKDGTEIQEGMQGSRADIVDFSVANNSVKYNKDEKLVEVLEALNKTLSNFNIQLSQKGGNDKPMNYFEELLAKYNKTVEDITFEYENLSDEELDAKFTEVFGKINENSKDSETKEDNACGTKKKKKCEEDESDSEEDLDDEQGDETEIKEDNACGTKKKKKCSIENAIIIDDSVKKYEVSLDDKICSIHSLVNETYADADGTYYGTEVFETYVIMIDYYHGRYYKQSYKDENDVYTLVGDRVEVFAEYVTAEEQEELKNIRANYSLVVEELNKYKHDEQFAEKMSVFNDEAYSNYLETDEFKALMSKENVDKYSKEELLEKADATLGKLVKTSKTFSFSENKENKSVNTVKMFTNVSKSKKASRYGDLFK